MCWQYLTVNRNEEHKLWWDRPGRFLHSVHCIVWSLARGGLLMHVPWAHASWMSWGGPSSWWSQEDWNCQGWHPEQKSGEETRTRQLWYVLLFFCYYVIFRFFFHVSFYDNIRFHVYSFLDVCLEELWLWTNNKRRIYIHCHFGCS